MYMPAVACPPPVRAVEVMVLEAGAAAAARVVGAGVPAVYEGEGVVERAVSEVEAAE
jgi:hypothetical protein